MEESELFRTSWNGVAPHYWFCKAVGNHFRNCATKPQGWLPSSPDIIVAHQPALKEAQTRGLNSKPQGSQSSQLGNSGRALIAATGAQTVSTLKLGHNVGAQREGTVLVPLGVPSSTSTTSMAYLAGQYPIWGNSLTEAPYNIGVIPTLREPQIPMTYQFLMSPKKRMRGKELQWLLQLRRQVLLTGWLTLLRLDT